jgi:hypothetical protein
MLTDRQKTQFNIDFGYIRARRPGDGPRASGFVLGVEQEWINYAAALVAAGSYAGSTINAADCAAWFISSGTASLRGYAGDNHEEDEEATEWTGRGAWSAPANTAPGGVGDWPDLESEDGGEDVFSLPPSPSIVLAIPFTDAAMVKTLLAGSLPAVVPAEVPRDMGIPQTHPLYVRSGRAPIVFPDGHIGPDASPQILPDGSAW